MKILSFICSILLLCEGHEEEAKETRGKGGGIREIRSYHIHVLSDDVPFLTFLREETLSSSFYGVNPLPRCVTLSRDRAPCTFRVNTPGGPFLTHH